MTRAALLRGSLLALVVLGCEEGPIVARRALFSPVVGCYSLDVSKIDSFYAPHLAATLGRFRLMADSVSLQHPELRRIDGRPPGATHELAMWSVDSSTDRIWVSVSDGFTGYTLDVRPDAKNLIGTAINFGDYGPTKDRIGRVRAVRAPWPAS